MFNGVLKEPIQQYSTRGGAKMFFFSPQLSMWGNFSNFSTRDVSNIKKIHLSNFPSKYYKSYEVLTDRGRT